MVKREKIFRNIISNSVIGLVVVAVLLFSINMSVVNTMGKESGVIYQGKSKTQVSLMVNVYWGTEYIEPMLEIFKKHNVKTTFFVGGMWVAENDTMLEKIYGDGHEIGNHGYFHKDHKNLNEQRNFEEMNVTHQLVKKIIGKDMTLFAPPSGSFGKTTLQVAERMGYKTIMWTLDTIDWRDKNANLIFNRATKKISGGSLVLMHPTQHTVEALDRILTEIYNKNLHVSTVTNVLRDDLL